VGLEAFQWTGASSIASACNSITATMMKTTTQLDRDGQQQQQLISR